MAQNEERPNFVKLSGVQRLGVRVVSIGHFPAFYVVLVPLEYVSNIPPHSSYVTDICFVLFKKKEYKSMKLTMT